MRRRLLWGMALGLLVATAAAPAGALAKDVRVENGVLVYTGGAGADTMIVYDHEGKHRVIDSDVTLTVGAGCTPIDAPSPGGGTERQVECVGASSVEVHGATVATSSDSRPAPRRPVSARAMLTSSTTGGTREARHRSRCSTRR